MTRFFKTAVLSLALGTTALTAVPANARDWHHRHHHNRSGDTLAAGALGLAAGAIIGGALSQPTPVYRTRRSYYEPAPRVIYRDPAPVYYRGGYALEPWTRDWYRACDARYRTFDPRSGTFMGYDGVRHFCNLD